LQKERRREWMTGKKLIDEIEEQAIQYDMEYKG
jgi:hypothetical protein